MIQLGGLLSVVGLTDRFGIVLGDDLQRTDGDDEGEGEGKDENKGGNGSQGKDGEGQGSGDGKDLGKGHLDENDRGGKRLDRENMSDQNNKDNLNKQGYATEAQTNGCKVNEVNSGHVNLSHQANQDKAATLLGLLLSVIEQLPETVDTEALKQKGIRFLKRRSAERHY